MLTKARTKIQKFLDDERDTLILATGFVGGSLLTCGMIYLGITYGPTTYLTITRSQMKLLSQKGFMVYDVPSVDSEMIVATRNSLMELREIIIKEALAGVK